MSTGTPTLASSTCAAAGRCSTWRRTTSRRSSCCWGPLPPSPGSQGSRREVRTSDIHPGVSFPVEVPTHVAGLLEFAAGPPATVTMSFDVWGTEAPRMEVYGTSGTLSVPDPNNFGGPVRVKVGGGEWEEVPLRFDRGRARHRRRRDGVGHRRGQAISHRRKPRLPRARRHASPPRLLRPGQAPSASPPPAPAPPPAKPGCCESKTPPPSFRP